MAMGSQPFYRAKAMAAKISDIIAAGGGQLKIQMAIQELGEYRSRGKSGKHSKPSRNWLRGTRSRYQPHQGAQESFRRVVGGWPATGTTKASLVSIPEFYPEGYHGSAR